MAVNNKFGLLFSNSDIRWVNTIRVLVLVCFLSIVGCTSSPPQVESLDYLARAETQVDGRVRVSAVVLSPQESESSFHVPLAKKNVQPIWLKIDNQEDKTFFLMALSIDPEYFSPSEVAWMFKAYDEHSLDEEDDSDEKVSLDSMIDLFLNESISVVVPPYSTVTGYVYTNLDPGVKAFAVELFGERDVRLFDFVQLVPGFSADFMKTGLDHQYPPDGIRDLDLDGLRQYIEALPCCVLGGDQKTPGDPLNLIIIGDGAHVLTTLVRRSWDLTETMRNDTMWRTAASSVFGSLYRTSPVSALYFFGRPQDVALQKARHTVNERNHLRLWRAPVNHDGQAVWVGQISRDIGVKLSSKTVITHKIDPVVDEARLYITLDVAASQTLRSVGYVKGVGYSDRETPRFNYTKDPYYTDGLRVILILGDGRHPLDSIEYLPWEQPKGREKLPDN